MGLEGLRVVARREKTVRLTALLHHITPQLLVESFYALRHDAAAGVDGVTWRDYEEGSYERVHGLHRKIHTGAYRAKPSRRVFIPKADGKWTQQWRRRYARGNVIVVRYADDSVFGFKSEETARRFLTAMKERLAKFGLTLNATKTRLIEFGRFAATNRKRRGQSKPETFDFLGFTHCCGTDRQGRFQVLRLTVKKRMRATLQAIRAELMRRRHESVAIVGKWLNRVVQGYFNYHAVPGNLYRLAGLRSEIGRAWRHALMRRSQRHRLT